MQSYKKYNHLHTTLLRVVKKFQDYAKVAQCDITVIISGINAISIYTLTTEDPGGSSRLEDPRAIYNAKLIKYRFAFFEITHILSASEGLFPLGPLPELCRWTQLELPSSNHSTNPPSQILDLPCIDLNIPMH